jgi:hypothetical protein
LAGRVEDENRLPAWWQLLQSFGVPMKTPRWWHDSQRALWWAPERGNPDLL